MIVRLRILFGEDFRKYLQPFFFAGEREVTG